MAARAEPLPARRLTARAERAAVAGALRGDARSLDVLFRAHWAGAYRTALLIARDEHAAEDLAQEGFLAAVGALERFDRSRPFGPWLRTIVARRAIDWVRARNVRREIGDAPLAALPFEQATEGLDDELLAAVAALPEQQRVPVVLRHLLELTPTEIAELLDLPRGTVNSRIRRGLDALRIAAAALAVAAAAIVLTAPGRATADWVRDQIRDVVGAAPPPTPRPVQGAAVPGGGRLLSLADQGPVLLGLGAPRLLPVAADDATWSPHARFIAVARGADLLAVDLHGRPRWQIAPGGAIRVPRWAPSGYRVAYLTETRPPGVGRRSTGRLLRVVAGDGTGDRPLAAAGPAAPAWRPGPGHVLAYADPAGRVLLRDADSGLGLWRARTLGTPRTLSWSRDGARLLVTGAAGTDVLGPSGTLQRRARAPRGTRDVASAAAPHGHAFALVRRTARSGEYRVLLVRGAQRRLLVAGTGRVRAIAWSPTGRWLAVDVAGQPELLLVGASGTALGTARTLAAGRGGRLAGWCCRR